MDSLPDKGEDGAGDPEGLRRRCLQLERTLRQSQRDRQRTETIMLRSKQAMIRVNQELVNSIEELRQTMQELAEAKRAAEKASEAKTRFVATISHELRTPMNGILGTAEILRLSEMGAESHDLVTIIQRSAKGLLAIINDVLDHSKAESGSMHLESTPFDLLATVEAIADLQLNAANDKGITLELRLDPQLPRGVIGDPVRLRQVLLNLLDNAVKFTCEGGVILSVAHAAAGQGMLQFAVEDSGIGIPAETQEAIFDPFVQADSSTTRRFGGSGLGLAICRKIVELMGGTLTLTSEPGVGSRFEFSVPLAACDTDRLLGETRVLPRGSLDLALRVLVVDDNPVNRLVARRMLEKLGCRSAESIDGAAAVDAVRNDVWDVVLMDCSMPVMDGYEATARIRELPGTAGRVPILAMTAHALDGDRERCLSSGMDGYLVKPLQIARLHAALLEAVAQARAKRFGAA